MTKLPHRGHLCLECSHGLIVACGLLSLFILDQAGRTGGLAGFQKVMSFQIYLPARPMVAL